MGGGGGKKRQNPGNEVAQAAAVFWREMVCFVFRTSVKLWIDWTEKMELSSPPKPIRIVDCLIPDAAVGTISPQAGQTNQHYDNVSEDVGEVTQMEAASLPALAGEVAVAQKQQISELAKKQEILDQLKVSSTS